MSQVTPQTVEIKKSPRSTFNKTRIKRGSARIGKLNVVEHLMMEPSDMVRCQVSTKILFISPLSVPAFAEMDVYTYYFFDAYQNVFSDFNETIVNYTHDTKTEFESGVPVVRSNYRLPWITVGDLSSYVCQGLHWAPPANSPAIVIPPFGDPNSYDTGFLANFVNYRMQYEFCFSTYEQKKDIAQLLNQFDIPYGCLIPLSKEFQNWFAPPNASVNNDPSFQWSNLTGYEKALYELPFSQYWSRELNFASTGFSVIQNAVVSGVINVLPMKCYQHIYNDWFLDTMKNLEIDIFKSNTAHALGTAKFHRTSTNIDLDNYAIGQGYDKSIIYQTFAVGLPSHEDNYLMNSLFAIRSPWYTKDYFNTQTNDPTLGVSPYAVGTSILDLRKNSALQRLAEKKALCGNKFVDFIAQHFNYYPPELDISRSIHLGTSVQTVDVTQVLQTSETTSQSAQGERAATAQSYGRSKGVFFKAPTYGEFMVLQCVKPKIDYYNGIPKEMSIIDVADIPLPELAQIGFDQCSSTELYVNPSQNHNYPTFGYVPRYSWRKTSLNRIYGELCNSLNFWHQSPDLKFGAYLSWNFGQIGFENHDSSFAYANSDTRVYSPSFNRIFAIQDASEDTYVYQHNIRLTLNTCLPTNDSPQL